MKARIVAHTPFETYSSEWSDVDKEQVEGVENFLKSCCKDGLYIELETEKFGKVYIPKGMIQRSILRLETKEEKHYPGEGDNY